MPYTGDTPTLMRGVKHEGAASPLSAGGVDDAGRAVVVAVGWPVFFAMALRRRVVVG